MNTPVMLRWATYPAVCAYHAADLGLHGPPIVDAPLAAALAQPLTVLASIMAGDWMSSRRFMGNLVPLAADMENKLELTRLALTKTEGRERAEAMVWRYIEHLAVIDSIFKAELPRLNETLPVHHEPLEEQWQAEGAELLAGIARWSEADFLITEAMVLAVHPVGGGAGAAHPFYNAVRIETVKTDPVPELPEILRLGWLVSLLNLKLPRYSECFANTLRGFDRGALALIPVTLMAAEEMGLTACNDQTLHVALRAWLGSNPDGEDAASQLYHWWEVYRDTRLAWPKALTALDRLLG